MSSIELAIHSYRIQTYFLCLCKIAFVSYFTLTCCLYSPKAHISNFIHYLIDGLQHIFLRTTNKTMNGISKNISKKNFLCRADGKGGGAVWALPADWNGPGLNINSKPVFSASRGPHCRLCVLLPIPPGCITLAPNTCTFIHAQSRSLKTMVVGPFWNH